MKTKEFRAGAALPSGFRREREQNDSLIPHICIRGKTMTAQTWTRRPLKTRDHNWAIRAAQWLAGAGVSPNAISLASVAFASAAAGALLAHGWLAAALFIQLRLLCNLLDGMVAVEGGRR